MRGAREDRHDVAHVLLVTRVILVGNLGSGWQWPAAVVVVGGLELGVF